MKKIILMMLLAFFMAGCASDTNTTYERGEVGAQGRVELGKIVDILPVTVAGSSTIGMLGGAVAGAAAGSLIGGNTAVNVIGGVGGALAGGAVGAAAEKSMTTQTAYEFIIKKTSGSVISVVQSNELNLRIGDDVYLTTTDGTTRIRGRGNL